MAASLPRRRRLLATLEAEELLRRQPDAHPLAARSPAHRTRHECILRGLPGLRRPARPLRASSSRSISRLLGARCLGRTGTDRSGVSDGSSRIRPRSCRRRMQVAARGDLAAFDSERWRGRLRSRRSQCGRVSVHRRPVDARDEVVSRLVDHPDGLWRGRSSRGSPRYWDRGSCVGWAMLSSLPPAHGLDALEQPAHRAWKPGSRSIPTPTRPACRASSSLPRDRAARRVADQLDGRAVFETRPGSVALGVSDQPSARSERGNAPRAALPECLQGLRSHAASSSGDGASHADGSAKWCGATGRSLVPASASVRRFASGDVVSTIDEVLEQSPAGDRP